MPALKFTSLFVASMIAVTACAGGGGASGGNASGGGDIKVAVLVGVSGPAPTFGISTRDGALMAIEEWNAKGGVNGHKIVPIVEDSQCTPDPALNAANKVVDQDGVKFMVAEACSKAAIPISEVANARKALMITPSAVANEVTVDKDGQVKPYVFRACFTGSFQGRVGAKFALETLQAKTAFIMLDQANDYDKGSAEAFEKAFIAGGGQIIGTETFTAKDTDFSAILSKVADVKPDMVYLPDYYNIVNLVTKQAQEKGITIPFLGGDAWDSSDLNTQSAAGSFFVNHYSPDDTRAEVQDFVKAYGSKYKNDKGEASVPDALAVLGYDATNMLLQSIKDAGSDDVEKVREAMAKLNFSPSFRGRACHPPTASR
ncbi:MAG: ABC transporter substrate-binding protein [Chloroflexi bacterium]|nr:ABC transporter substrate-binding protein [Chloroflexota bacterium]